MNPNIARDASQRGNEASGEMMMDNVSARIKIKGPRKPWEIIKYLIFSVSGINNKLAVSTITKTNNADVQ